MQNVFDATNEKNNTIRRNPHDWSHTSSFTARFGYAYPIFSQLVPPNSSLKIKADLGLQLMPMVFPVQTKMKARLSFFKVPLRTLWDDYKDYIGNFRDNLEEPYLDFASSFDKMIGVGKLLDWLDVPVVAYGDSGSYLSCESIDNPVPLSVCSFDMDGVNQIHVGAAYSGSAPSQSKSRASYFSMTFGSTVVGTSSSTMYFNSLLSKLPSRVALSSGTPVLTGKNSIYFAADDGTIRFFSKVGTFTYEVDNGTTYLVPNFDFTAAIYPSSDVDLEGLTCYLVFAFNEQDVDTVTTSFAPSNQAVYASTPGPLTVSFSVLGYQGNYTELTPTTSPYYSSSVNPTGLQLKAYKPRAYEAIYNAYFRDNRNNPYYVNGEVQYNKWIPSKAGGADKIIYQLRRVAWEKDFLTTAVPSPQQGKAPLVGLTTYATTNSEGVNELKTAVVDENGQKFAVNFTADENGVTGVSYAPLSENTPVQPLQFRSLVDSASTGISIPDLRVVNAYQKFLELNMRKGFSYKEIIEGRFDCQVRYDDLDIPEFLGGYTRDINMNRVVQSVEKGDGTGLYADALGSLAGDGFLSTGGNVPDISVFCDEECIVMGILSIVPIPLYSQLLPKDYLYSDLLDHFQPEFDNLGFQPISYAEVCPIQAKLAGKSFSDTFGYQRPWYEYVQKYDTAHGLIRTQLRNFVMNRTFDALPALSESFLLVDDEQLNDVFAVTETTDKIIGQVYFSCVADLPVSRVAIPRLD